jgi:uncharacterized cupin superfamily protein
MKVHSLFAAAVAVAAGVATLAGASPGETSRATGIVEVDPARVADIALSPMQSTPHMKLMGTGDAGAGYRTDFSSADGHLSIGVALHDTVTLELTDWPIDEFMYFVEGQVEIRDAEGRGRIYGPGDAIVMPKGFTGTWRQLGPIKKIAVVYSP